MTMTTQTVAPRPGSIRSVPLDPMDERLDALKVAGLTLFALAVLNIVETAVLAVWFGERPNLGSTGLAVGVYVLFGIALVQGADIARKILLFLTGLGLLGFALVIVALFAVGFGHMWPIFASAYAIGIGLFIMLWGPELRRVVAFVAIALVGGGWIGSIVSSIVLIGAVDLATVKLIVQWSEPDRTYEDKNLGVTMRLPASWVALKDGSPFASDRSPFIAADDKPLVTLANMEMYCLAQLLRQERDYSERDTPEFVLDTMIKAKAGRFTKFEVLSNSDVTIGAVPAKRVRVSWTKDKTPLLASFTMWKDGGVFHTLHVSAPAFLSRRLDAEVDALEHGIALTQPWTAFIRETSASMRQDCPLLTDRLVIGLTKIVAAGSGSDAYCREAFRLAFVGESRLGAGERAHLLDGMRAFYAAVPRASASRLGAYIERVRASQPTPAKDDAAMMIVIRTAFNALAVDVQDDLRRQFGIAVGLGQFSEAIGRR